MDGGMVAVLPYEPGTEVIYSCRHGLKLFGASISMCLEETFTVTQISNDLSQNEVTELF